MTKQFNPVPKTASLFIMLFCADVTALIAEKIATRCVGQAMGNETMFYFGLLKTGWTWLAIGLGPIQLMLWSSILKKTDLSLAYCIMSLGYPLTMVAAVILLQEQLGWQAWVGAAFVTFGAALIGSDQKSSLIKDPAAQTAAQERAELNG